MKILHIITGLGDGGAEGVLSRICLHDKESKHIVISFMDEGKYGPILRENNIEVICLGLDQGRFSIQAFFRLIKLLKKIKPDVVQTWMYHADLIGGIAARLAGIKNVYWGIRHSTLVPGKSKRTTIIISKVCALLSYVVPKSIVCCAHDALEVHKNLGYKASKLLVIGNGYDLSRFDIASSNTKSIREFFNISVDEFLIGTVARYNPQKDHYNLLLSLQLIKTRGVPFKCILVGKGLSSDNHEIVSQINELNLTDNIILAGPQSEIPALMNSLDLHVLPSAFGEGFPNVIAESMACGTPNVATNVGDSKVIIGDTGWVVEPKDPQNLSESLLSALHEFKQVPDEWHKRKVECRKTILNRFSIENMVGEFLQVWKG